LIICFLFSLIILLKDKEEAAEELVEKPDEPNNEQIEKERRELEKEMEKFVSVKCLPSSFEYSCIFSFRKRTRKNEKQLWNVIMLFQKHQVF